MNGYTITLKFSDGRTETATVLADNPRDFQKKVEALMARKGAYGFGTQSRW